jgi:hypothetical protein
MKRLLFAILAASVWMRGWSAPETAQDNGILSNPTGWAEPTTETRPWTRWWWMGSAVDETNLTRMLTEFRDAGIGGVEICPIYGVKGYEKQFIDFLSPRWVQMFDYTVAEADRLGLGVDLTTGTGWPFGGPHVTPADASSRIRLTRLSSPTNGVLPRLPNGELQCLMAFLASGEVKNLTDDLQGGKLNWTAPGTGWRLYALTAERPIQQVKRAAPGGEGNVLNPYSVTAMNDYLSGFDAAFATGNGARPRAFFHDSFEYYHADWAPDFLEQFRQRRGYDLREELPALAGDGDRDRSARVQHDFRETLSDLHIAYIGSWTAWAHGRNCLTRNQAHGSPANLVDAYAAADIPETEIFGGLSEQNILMNKFASSAAHLSGRRLSSAESFTWLTEHFHASLAQVKTAADSLFLAGVNHILFHGIPYSPAGAPWPGWQFYAAVNFGPDGGLWHDLPFFNDYVTRCESILQGGAPANDVLLYFPVHDFWQCRSNLLMLFDVETANQWLATHPIHDTADFLQERGYGYDVLTDNFLEKCLFNDGRIIVNGNRYRTILIPPTQFMPETSLQQLIELARAGATIVFEKAIPSDVPGWGRLAPRRAAWQHTVSGLNFVAGDVQHAELGSGRFLLGTNLTALLTDAGVDREPCVDSGLQFIRRSYDGGCHYFMLNRSEAPVDGWISLGTHAVSALLLDPRWKNRTGRAALKNESGGTQIYLQLAPGESVVVRTFAREQSAAAPWNYFREAGQPQPVTGPWQVRFIEGGPTLPPEYQTSELTSWTTRTNAEYQRFAGTASYAVEFEKPDGSADDWLLDLGHVCESARVRLNGRMIGALWCPPFEIAVGPFLKPGTNRLEVEVTNLAANRIRDLDRQKVRWKYFYDINVVGRDYHPLDASNWPLHDSGLLGPVVLKPVKFLPVSK